MKQRKMPLRKCTGCGEMKEKRELIRVVKAPDTKDENGEIIAKGEISLDLTGRKAGRGAYVCRNLACFEKARKARRFERSLSCKIPDEVYEQMQSELAAADSEQTKGFFMNDRILSLLGICKRAGKLITGADTTIDSIRKSKAKLVIFANDFSKSSFQSIGCPFASSMSPRTCAIDATRYECAATVCSVYLKNPGALVIVSKLFNPKINSFNPIKVTSL